METKWLNRCLIEGPYNCLCLTQKELDKALKHVGDHKEEFPKYGARVVLLEKNGKRTAIVALNLEQNVDMIQVTSIIVHEAVHIKQEYMRSIGEAKPSDEFEAYVVQGLTQILLDELYSRVKLVKGFVKRK